MLRYNLLFIHVLSAMGIFTALGMEALALTQLRRASDNAGARAALAALGSSQRVLGPSALVLLLSGVYLATAYWHWKGAWMGLGFLGLVATGVIGGLVTGRRVGRLLKDLREGGAGTPLVDVFSVLRNSFALRAVLLAGVVYLMTVKPGGATG